MYTKSVLSLDQCQAAIAAMIADYNKDTSRRPIAMAIVDDTGNLISFARTDRARLMAGRNCIKKAYTAAIMVSDTVDYAARLKEQGRSVADSGDPMLSGLQGGVVILNPADGTCLGGIGVGGLPTGVADEEIARVGLQALGL